MSVWLVGVVREASNVDLAFWVHSGPHGRCFGLWKIGENWFWGITTAVHWWSQLIWFSSMERTFNYSSSCFTQCGLPSVVQQFPLQSSFIITPIWVPLNTTSRFNQPHLKYTPFLVRNIYFIASCVWCVGATGICRYIVHLIFSIQRHFGGQQCLQTHGESWSYDQECNYPEGQVWKNNT